MPDPEEINNNKNSDFGSDPDNTITNSNNYNNNDNNTYKGLQDVD